MSASKLGDHDPEPEPDAWNGWSSKDEAAVEEAERFDDISVVGFLDEEQELESKRMHDRKHSSVLVENSNIKREARGRRRDI